MTACALAAIGGARPALRAALPADPGTALVTDALVLCPLILLLRVLWAGSSLRATGWRRAAVRGAVSLLGAVCCATIVSILTPRIPRAMTLAPAPALALALACSSLACAIYWTSPARRIPRAPRRP